MRKKHSTRPSDYSSNPDAGVGLYMSKAGETKLLTPEEEIELAKKIKEGDVDARDHMIRANLRLVIKIAKDYDDLGLPLLDLINEGNLGMMHAVKKYDLSKGAKFSTYASWWIRQAIKRALSNQSKTIRLPVHIVDKMFRIRKVSATLYDLLGREATPDEIGEEMGMPGSRVERLLGSTRSALSLELPTGHDDDSTLGEIIRDESVILPDDGNISRELKRDVAEVLQILTERERTILKHRFGLDGSDEMTLEEVGKMYKITRERIRQIQDATLRKIKRIWEARDKRMEEKAIEYRESRSLTA